MFFLHWARNRRRFADLTVRAGRARRWAAGLGAAWLALFFGAAYSWAANPEAGRQIPSYQDLAAWPLLLGAVLALAGFVVTAPAAVRRVLAVAPVRGRARGAVDASLATAAVVLAASGLLLAFGGGLLPNAHARLTMRWVHVVSAGAGIALVAWHAAFNRRAFGAHARRLDREWG
jgi:hypothetical protein